MTDYPINRTGIYRITSTEGKVETVRVFDDAEGMPDFHYEDLEWPRVEFIHSTKDEIHPLETIHASHWEFRGPLEARPAEALAILDVWFPYTWMSVRKESLMHAALAALRLLQGCGKNEVEMEGLVLHPNPYKALEVLRGMVNLDSQCLTGDARETHSSDLILTMSSARGWLRGYKLREEDEATYVCNHCEAKGVKLWRAIHDGHEKWCAKCAMEQAGLDPADVDDDGRVPTEHSSNIDGRSDQIYSSMEGLNLLPCVPTPDGGTWGYTSVPSEGCIWWKKLPTRFNRPQTA